MRTVIYIMAGAGFTVSAIYFLGVVFVGMAGVRLLSKWEHRLFSFISGSACLSLIVFLLCAAHLAYKGVFVGLGAVAIVVGWRFRERSREDVAPGLLLMVPLVIFGCVYVICALAPESSPDGATYHLGFVTRYQHWHGFQPITTNMYANMPQATEMLFLPAFSIGRHSAAALVHLAFLFVLALLLWSYGARRETPLAGAFAGAVVFMSPLFGVDATSAYNDVALAAAGFGCFYALEIWRDGGDMAALVLAGSLAGFAFSIKLTGIFVILYAVGVLVLARQWRTMPAFVLPVFILITPWLLKSYLVTGNPVSPFLNRWFPNPYIHVLFEQRYARNMRETAAMNFHPPLTLTWTGAAGGTLGPAFLLLPVGLLALRNSAGRRLWAAAVVFAMMYPLNTGARFLMLSAPLLALAIGQGLTRRPLLYLAVAGQALFAWPSILNRVRAPECWSIQEIPWRAALRIEPEEIFIRRRMPDYDMARFIEKTVPSGERVLALDPVAEAYTTKTVLVSYESAEGERERDILLSPVIASLHPDRVFRYTFPAQSIRGFRLEQSAQSETDVWSIHEIVVRNGGVELKADGWKCTAHPFPWDASFAIDGNLATKWSSWRPLELGMHFDVSFPQATVAESVSVVGTSEWQGKVDAALVLIGQDGGVRTIPRPRAVKVNDNLRLDAVAALKKSGTRFLMVPDQSEWSHEFLDRQQEWGISFLGEWGAGRLYRLD